MKTSHKSNAMFRSLSLILSLLMILAAAQFAPAQAQCEFLRLEAASHGFCLDLQAQTPHERPSKRLPIVNTSTSGSRLDVSRNATSGEQIHGFFSS